jgi:anti-anti-sigma regulatory factor
MTSGRLSGPAPGANLGWVETPAVRSLAGSTFRSPISAAVALCLRRGDCVSVHSLSPSGSPQGDPTPFLVRIDLTCGRLQLSGQLDRSTVHLLHDAISTLLLTDRDSWVVDATDLTGCDHRGVSAIGAAYRRALRHNRRMTLIGCALSLQRDLARLRLDHISNSADGVTASPDSSN